jgi:hypothetical protein
MDSIIETGTIRTGVVSVKDAVLLYEPLQGQKIQISLAEIAVIGEYTINKHPFAKGNWHVAFVKRDGIWQHIPAFTQNMPQLLDYLSHYFKTDFNLYDLSQTIRAKSIIRYPNGLKGKPLFNITPPKNYKPTATPLRQMLQRLLAPGIWKLELTAEVKAFFQEA